MCYKYCLVPWFFHLTLSLKDHSISVHQELPSFLQLQYIPYTVRPLLNQFLVVDIWEAVFLASLGLLTEQPYICHWPMCVITGCLWRINPLKCSCRSKGGACDLRHHQHGPVAAVPAHRSIFLPAPSTRGQSGPESAYDLCFPCQGSDTKITLMYQVNLLSQVLQTQ